MDAQSIGLAVKGSPFLAQFMAQLVSVYEGMFSLSRTKGFNWRSDDMVLVQEILFDRPL
jgi:hypothetical protein